MKTLTTIFAMALMMVSAQAVRAADGDVHEKVVNVSDAYIPSGFDSTSESFVVVNGWFPHSCYKLKTVEVANVGPFLHELTTKADVTEGLCLTVIIPWHREVQLGKLATGDHKLHFMNGDGTYMEKHLTIGN
ncbi:MAG: hypothetical protein ACXVB9_06115 [Bdellovibrionota bacterium]